jgi:spermidine synthase
MTRLRPVLALIGFTAVVAQVVLMRELLVLFGGAEISLGLMLASWLAWTAAGSGIVGRRSLPVAVPCEPRSTEPRATASGTERILTVKRLATLDILIAAVLPLTILAARAAKSALQFAPGELAGPGAMLAASLVALGPFCVLSGWLFSAGSRAYAAETGTQPSAATASVYLLEAAGSAAGGLAASLLLLRFLSPIQIAFVVALCNLTAAWLLLRSRIVLGFALLALFAIPFFAPRLEWASLARLWRPFNLIAARNSIYGNLVLAGREGGATLYENGLAVATVPDPAAAEENVHYALLQHPSPATLLLIGGGIGGGLAEALKHPSLQRVDYVELDPTILDLAEEHLSIPRDPRIHIHHTDGRLYVKTATATFDVIIVNLPDPQTAQLNRFYTLEFFREVRSRLTRGGVFSLRLTSSENYISPERASFLRCIHKTLGAVFPEITFLPGGTLHLFAAKARGMLLASAEGYLDRLRARGIRTTYVNAAYLPFRLTPDRVEPLAAELQPRHETPLNRDFSPIAYYFDAVLWSTRFGRSTGQWLTSLSNFGFARCLVVFALAALIPAALIAAKRKPAPAAGLAVATMGFCVMGLEILLLVGFQAIHGYVYHQLAILIAMFMAGIAAGSWWSLRSGGGMRRLAVLQIAAAAAPLLLCLALEALSRAGPAMAFPALALLSGLLGGYQFPLASRIFFAAGARGGPGTLYALDLAGACAGSILLSALLIPLFGFWKASLVMAVVCLAPALPAWTSIHRAPKP